jgi:hypothetical protein
MRIKTVVAVAAGMATVCGTALAQGQGAPQPFAIPPGAPGGFGGAMSAMTMGTIRQIDREKNAIQVQTFGQNGPQDTWVTVAPDAVLFAQGAGNLADLKPNDTIVVNGFPTAITAAQIQVGEMPPPFGGPRNGPAGFVRPNAGPPGAPGLGGIPPAPGAPPGAPPGNNPAAVPGNPRRPGGFGAGFGPGGFGGFGGPLMTRAAGTVVSTQPLVVMMPDNVKLSVEASPNTRISKISRITVADLKVGDSIRAMGQPKDGGAFVASRIEVGFDLTPGFGGFGGGAFRLPGAPGAPRPLVPGAPGAPPRPNQPPNP